MAEGLWMWDLDELVVDWAGAILPLKREEGSLVNVKDKDEEFFFIYCKMMP